MDQRLVKLELFGQEYQLYTDAPDEELEEILRLVKGLHDQHRGQSSTGNLLPSIKVAILGSLNMAGKYVRLKHEFERYRADVEKRARRLSEEVEQEL